MMANRINNLDPARLSSEVSSKINTVLSAIRQLNEIVKTPLLDPDVSCAGCRCRNTRRVHGKH